MTSEERPAAAPSPEERIRELARKNRIAKTEAVSLLAAVRPASESLGGAAAGGAWNPFERLSTGRCVAIGIVATIAIVLLGRLGIRTNGALDFHNAKTAVPWSTALLDQIVAFPLFAAALWAAGRLLTRHVRFVDLLATVGVARIPATLVSLPLVFLEHRFPRALEDHHLNAVLVVELVLALVSFGVQITLLVLGFRTATSLRGGRLAAGFVGGLIVAEVSGLVLLHAIGR